MFVTHIYVQKESWLRNIKLFHVPDPGNSIELIYVVFRSILFMFNSKDNEDCIIFM